jgi:hypothetical protein
MMKEVPYSIGKSPRLVGIYTESDLAESEADSRDNKPTILLLNSGLIPNMGPYRLYVELARRFAKMGFNTFRFDFSGIGNSDQHADATRTLDELYMNDLKTVMDFFEAQQGACQFILMGICSGARYAHDGTVMDARVVGAVCIDGYLYRTLKYYIYMYGSKLFSLSSLLSALKMMFRKILPLDNSDAGLSLSTQETTAFSYSKDSRKRVEMDFRKLIERGVSLLCIFTGSFCRYKDQLADNFKKVDFGENIKVTYLRDAEHVFPLTEDRDLLITAISNWLKTKFPKTLP